MPAWTKPLAAGIKEKRTSVSSRYQGVRSVIDSGFNELRAKAQNADARPQARFQHGEPFKRIKARQMADIITGRISGICSLVLDVREAEGFNECHLMGAVLYPARLLSRAVNPLSNEVLEHVNAEDSIIVLYDWEGNTAGPACALLSEKGVENVMLLHGGMRAFAGKHPDLLEGQAPTLASPRYAASSVGSTVSQAVSCSAAVRRARQHISQQSERGAWPSETSLLIVPPRLGRGSFAKPLEPLHLGQPSQTASATAGPWK